MGDHLVSTIFTGTNSNLMGDVPIVFETMVFGPDDSSWSYYRHQAPTWMAAEMIHKTVVELIEHDGDDYERRDDPLPPGYGIWFGLSRQLHRVGVSE